MNRKQGLVPIGEVFGGRAGPLKAIREALPQARHHFTQADQVNQLATARVADPNLAFAAVVSAAFLVPAGWWPEAPGSETAWNILAILVAALITVSKATPCRAQDGRCGSGIRKPDWRQQCHHRTEDCNPRS